MDGVGVGWWRGSVGVKISLSITKGSWNLSSPVMQSCRSLWVFVGSASGRVSGRIFGHIAGRVAGSASSVAAGVIGSIAVRISSRVQGLSSPLITLIIDISQPPEHAARV